MEYVGSQDPDGYVIGFAPVEIAMLNTTQSADVLPDDFDLLGQIMLAPGVITVGANSGIETLDDLVTQAKSGAVTVANSGAGSIWEAATLGLGQATDADFTPSPTTAAPRRSRPPRPVRPSPPSPDSARRSRRARPSASSRS